MRHIYAHGYCVENMRMNTTPRPRERALFRWMYHLLKKRKTLRHQPFHPHNSALEDVVRLKRQAMWREENKTAIEASNLCGGTSCPASDGLRL
jgi:hypothetical protein